MTSKKCEALVRSHPSKVSIELGDQQNSASCQFGANPPHEWTTKPKQEPKQKQPGISAI